VQININVRIIFVYIRLVYNINVRIIFVYIRLVYVLIAFYVNYVNHVYWYDIENALMSLSRRNNPSQSD